MPFLAQGAVTLEATGPYEITDSDIVYFSADPSFSGIMDESAGFQNFDLTLGRSSDVDGDGDGLGDQMLRFKVTSNQTFSSATSTTPLVISVFAKAKSGGELVPVPIAAVGGSVCAATRCQDRVELNDVSYYFAALSTSSSTNVSAVEVGLYPKDICAVLYAQSPGNPVVGCTANFVESPTTSTPVTFNLTFAVGVATDTNSSLDPATSNEKSEELTVSLHAAAPAFTCPSMSGLYTPGDGQISIKTSFVEAGSSGNAPLDKLIVVGAEGAVPVISDASFATANNIFGRLDINSGEQLLGGFTNTTDGTDHLYSLRFSVRDLSGRVAAFATDSSCSLDDVQTSEIRGFLSKSQCFIATATFESDRHPAVLLLRRFRDEILLQSWLGRKSVDFYYSWSPQAADWLIVHEEWRPVIKFALAPLIGLAIVILDPRAWGGLVTLVLGLVLLRRQLARQRGVLPLRRAAKVLAISFLLMQLTSCSSSQLKPEAPTGSVENDPNAPYITKIRQSITQDSSKEGPGEWIEKQRLAFQADNKPETGKSYIEKIQTALKREEEKKEAPQGSYIDQAKKRIAEAEEDAGTPPVTSLIADVKNGVRPKAPQKDGAIHHAMGFKVGASLQRTVSTPSSIGSGVDFEGIYTTQIAPDLMLHYEFQPFHSEWFGSVGLGGQVGVALYRGTGSYSVSLPGFGATSDTQFRFLFLPVMLTANYRLNLLRVVRPFIQAGAGINYFREWRDDGGESLQGYSRAMMVTGGLAINLDYLMSASGWSLYEERGIQHSYLTIDYTQYRHLSGDLSMQASGIQAGLTYEF
jgi:hypothetical protein